MAGCISEVKHAMRVSSLKGLPRIMSATNWVSRIIWIVAVICFLCVCILTVSTNISKYFMYPKVVNVEEKLINVNDPNGTVPFPSVAICNTNPFSTNKAELVEGNIPLPADYVKKIYQMTACNDCNAEKKKLADLVKRMLMTNRGYYQYAGMEAMIKMSNPDLILQCQAVVLSGTSLAAYPCEQLTRKSTFVHPDVGVCYVYEAELPKNTIVLGYNFMLHLDNSIYNLYTDFESQFLPMMRSGAIIYTFDPYIVPNTLGSSATAAPGMATTLYMKAKRIDRLSKPYSDKECIDAKHFGEIHYYNRTFNYDEMHCLGECTIQYTRDHCNCTNLFLLQNPEFEPPPPPYEYCVSLKQSVGQLFEKMACAEEVKDHAYSHCKEKCKEPCKEIKYILRSATAKWPLPSQVPSFYKKVIFNHTNLREQYKQHEETAYALVKGFKNVSHLDRLVAYRAIEENFALVNVYLSDYYYTHLESKPKMTLDALISQLGGSFNLWSGITVVLIVEIIDLIIKIICGIWKEPEESPNQNNTELKRTDTKEKRLLHERLCGIHA